MLAQVKQIGSVLHSFYYKIRGREGLYSGRGCVNRKFGGGGGKINNYKRPNELTTLLVEILAVWMMLNEEGVWRTEWMRLQAAKRAHNTAREV